jgi:hypothetical protein
MQQKTINVIAKVALIVVLISIASELAIFFQTEYQLISPIIPEKIVLDIVRPYLFMALVSTLGYIIALILFFYQRHILTIIFCGIILLFQEIYFNIKHFF